MSHVSPYEHSARDGRIRDGEVGAANASVRGQYPYEYTRTSCVRTPVHGRRWAILNAATYPVEYQVPGM
jgi:hypothetical protein